MMQVPPSHLTYAPKRSIILHTERHGALYSARFPRFTISYPNDGLDLVAILSVPDYVSCVEILDIKASVILRCQSSDTVTVMTFSNVIISAIANMISNPYTQHIIKGFLDISL
jgi:hypothetical protein